MRGNFGNKVTNIILGIALLGLSGCGTMQAKEGAIYQAGSEGAKVSTVIGMRKIVDCSVDPGTVAYGTRKTFFGSYQGGGKWEYILLTQIVHVGPDGKTKGCSDKEGRYDFIKERPDRNGWEELKPGSPEWVSALGLLCGAELSQPDQRLRELCGALPSGVEQR